MALIRRVGCAARGGARLGRVRIRRMHCASERSPPVSSRGGPLHLPEKLPLPTPGHCERRAIRVSVVESRMGARPSGVRCRCADGRLRMHGRMQSVSDNFQTFDQTRTRTAEVMRAVGDIDSPLPDGRHGLPMGIVGELGEVFQRSVNREAAARDKNHIRLRGRDFFPAERPRRRAGASDDLFAAGKGRQLRAPMPARKRRVQPFQQRDARTVRHARRPFRDGGDASLETCDDLVGDALAADGFRHLVQTGEDFGERPGFEIDDVRRSRQDAGGGFDFFFGDGADIAQSLRDDEVRPEGLQDWQIKRVKRLYRLKPFADKTVNFETCRILWNERMRDRRQIADKWRVVAFVRDAHKLAFESERADDFGRAGQERNDA